MDGSGIILLEYENCLVSIHISKISQGRSGFLIEGEHYTIQSNTAVSVLDTVIYDDDQAITQMQSYSNMYYSLKEIFNCIQMDDASYYDEHIKQTTQVVKLLEYLRLQNEIIFE